MNNVAAIELGSEKIACAIASIQEENNKKQLRIIGFASSQSKGIKRAQIIDIQEVTSALENCLTQTERMAGTRINKAILVISGPNIASQTSHGIVAVSYQNRDIQEEDVERAIESAKAISLAANRQIVHVLPKQFIVDGQGGIKNPVGMNGVRLEVETHIITANSTNLGNIQKTCNLLGINVDRFIFSGLASSEAVVNETEKELGCVLIDIGGGTSDLCVYVDGAITHTAVIPLGAKNVTSDIAAGLRISLDSAEKIKLYLAKLNGEDGKKSGSKKNLDSSDELSLASLHLPEQLQTVSRKILVNGIIKPRLEEIAEFVYKELQNFDLKDQTPAGLIITGGGAQTPYLTEVLKKELSLPVRVGFPLELAGISEELTEPRYAALVGALVYSLHEQQQTDKIFTLPELPSFLKNIELKEGFKKTVDFLKSFIPGVK